MRERGAGEEVGGEGQECGQIVKKMSFPNHFSFTLMENIMRSRKDGRTIHKDLGQDNRGADRIQLHLHEAT